jgi:hypothetical protein
VTTLDEHGEVVGTPSPLPTSAISGLPATYGGGDLWPVVDGEKMSLLCGGAYFNEPTVHPDLNRLPQPANGYR